MKTENKDTIEDTEVKEVSHQEDGDFNEPKDDEFDALWDVSLSLSAIRRPGVDPGEPAPHEDDDASASNMSLSSLIRGLAFEPKSRAEDTGSTHPHGDIKSLLDSASNSSFDYIYDSSLAFVDTNNGETVDAFKGHPDPPESVYSRSNHQSVPMDPPTHQAVPGRQINEPVLSDGTTFFTGCSNTVTPKQKTLSVKTTSTVLDTTSDSSIEKNNFSAFGEEKVEELDKRRCCHCIKNKILIFGPLIALIAIISSVSLMSRMGIITFGSSVYTEVPSVVPSRIPSDLPSMVPSSLPTNSLVPSSKPSLNPSSSPSQNPSYLETEAIFYAIGDVPYFDFEKTQLRTRLRELPEDGEFLIHLGDIRKSTFNQGIYCQIEEYQDAHDILLESKIPVFIIPGGKTTSLEKNVAEVVG